jgi:hypothetical protein
MNPNFDQPDVWANLAAALVEAVDGVRAEAGVVLKDGLAVSVAPASSKAVFGRSVRHTHCPPSKFHRRSTATQ